MKIVIIQGAFLPVPPIRGGAVEKIWYKMGQEFVKLGHEVIHIGRSHPELAESELVNGARYIRIKGYDIPFSLLKLKWLDLLYSFHAIRHIPKDTDIIVTNTFWSPVLLRGNLGKRVYVSVERLPKGQMRFYKHVGTIRGCSPLIFNLIKKEINPKFDSKVSYIPNPVPFDVKEFNSEKKKIILFVGRLNKEKGLEILIDAFNKLDRSISTSWLLNIVGPHEVKDGGSGDNYLAYLKQISQSLNINFIGPVFNEDELIKYYIESKIFCYPAQNGSGDAAPVAPREAMAYGCVPIVSKLECFNDFINNGVNGFQFDQGSKQQSAELSGILFQLMSNEIETEVISNQAKLIVQDYSSPVIASLFIDDFKKQIKRNG